MTNLSLPLRALALLAAAAPILAGAARAAEAPLEHELGTRHRFVENAAGPYPAAGCLDHRTLMFVVRETAGDDPAAAKMLAARDCRPLVPGADYVRCGPGGWAYPAIGDRLSYAAYCRLGANDLPLYVLDSQMQPSGDAANGPR